MSDDDHIIRGGQGRTDDEMERDGVSLMRFCIAGIVLLIVVVLFSLSGCARTTVVNGMPVLPGDKRECRE